MSTILIVEDEADLARVVKQRLTNQGFKVFVVDQGSKAISFARKLKPDLIILDLILPGMHGLQIIKELSSSIKTQVIPVMVLTGNKDKAYKSCVLEQGVEAYMEKPYDPQELISTVKEILAKRNRS
jgi:DNA-binding response OmpR family regulator